MGIIGYCAVFFVLENKYQQQIKSQIYLQQQYLRFEGNKIN